MSANAVALSAAAANGGSPMSSRDRFVHTFLQHRLAVWSAVYLAVLVLVAIFGQQFLIHDPNEADLAHVLESPSAEHWLGTDHLGRSTLARVVVATSVALKAAALGVGIAIFLGAPLGLLSGYFGGWWDRIAMRVVEAMIALPGLLVAIAILAILGPSLTNAMIALGIANSTAFFRLMRGASLEVRKAVYIDAAQVIGASTSRIVFRHVLPNVTGPLTVQLTLAFSFVLLAEAGLSFIGLGVQPPQSSWGVMLSTAQNYVYQQPFLAVPPGLMIMFTVLAFNMLGDGLRDALARVGAAHINVGKSSATSGETAEAELTTTKSESLLTVTGLDVRFRRPLGDEISVVSNVGFSVQTGKTLGLVGESGCGKSVTAMAVTGLLPGNGRLAHGSVLFDGRELTTMNEEQLNTIRGADISMIFQEPMTSLNPAYTVSNQIAESLRVHEGMTARQATTRAMELLGHVGIPDAARRANDYPHQFSGGMAQRAMIAMALACNPKLLIADEPTTALDVTTQAQILDLLSALQAEHGMSILLITHDLGVVADMCEDAVVMYAGQVVESGEAATVLCTPRHPYTAGLLASTPHYESRVARLKTIPGTVPPAWAWPEGCRFHPRCPHAADACRKHVPLQTTGDGQRIRCARVDDIDLDSTW
jgi:peptide/nickel transport system permease protein